jgi:hypothetical protein
MGIKDFSQVEMGMKDFSQVEINGNEGLLTGGNKWE